jgi:hypothetical protein
MTVIVSWGAKCQSISSIRPFVSECLSEIPRFSMGVWVEMPVAELVPGLLLVNAEVKPRVFHFVCASLLVVGVWWVSVCIIKLGA